MRSRAVAMAASVPQRSGAVVLGFLGAPHAIGAPHRQPASPPWQPQVAAHAQAAPACSSARGVACWQPQVQALPGQRAQVQEGVVSREFMVGSKGVRVANRKVGPCAEFCGRRAKAA